MAVEKRRVKPMLAVVSRSKGVEKTGGHELSDPDDWRNAEIPSWSVQYRIS
jgi:hypothetical protein